MNKFVKKILNESVEDINDDLFFQPKDIVKREEEIRKQEEEIKKEELKYAKYFRKCRKKSIVDLLFKKYRSEKEKIILSLTSKISCRNTYENNFCIVFEGITKRIFMEYFITPQHLYINSSLGKQHKLFIKNMFELVFDVGVKKYSVLANS